MISKHVNKAFMTVIAFLSLISVKVYAFEELSEADLNRIDSYIETQIREADIPGAALVIVEGDRITHFKGFGISGPDGKPVTAETAFRLGSISKSFTALAIMQLVEENQIVLDAPVKTYLPWFRVADPEASKQIHVRHLLCQTSGLALHVGRSHFADTDMSDKAVENRVRDLRTARLSSSPGERFQYCNTNYTVLAAIVESVTGQKFEQYIQAHVFDPLAMTNSYTSMDQARQNDCATGYRYWFGYPIAATNIRYSRGGIGAGGILSCAKDMGNYLLAFMKAGVLGDTRILSSTGISTLQTSGPKSKYAMGWVATTSDGTQILEHGGSSVGFHTRMAIFPERQRAFALLINAENYLSGPEIHSFSGKAMNLILGHEESSIGKAPTIHILLAILCVVFLCQFAGLITICRRIIRQRKHLHTHTRLSYRAFFLCRILPLILSLVIVVGVFVVVPRIMSISLSGILRFAPDGGWLLLLNGAFAIALTIMIIGVTVWQIMQSNQAETGTA